MRLLFLCAAMASGCSLQLDLDGPPPLDLRPLPDAASDLAVEDAADVLAVVSVDAGVDAAPPDMAPPAMTTVRAPGGTVIIEHPAEGDPPAPRPVDASGDLAVRAEDGDQVTAVFEATADGRAQVWLITYAELAPDERVTFAHPAPSAGRMTNMQLRLDDRLGDADGYVISNGCVSQRCAGETCDPWFRGQQRSLAVTDRCIEAGDRVRTLAVALAGDLPVAWAGADDPVPEAGERPPPSLSGWTRRWAQVRLSLRADAAKARIIARPFGAAAFSLGPDLEIEIDGRLNITVPLPRRFTSHVELGVDLLEEGASDARDRPARAWRSYFPEPPEALEIDAEGSVPSQPTARFHPDPTGPRPIMRWSAPDAASGDAARIELQWETEDQLINWVLFAPADREELELPSLPDAVAGFRPPDGARGNFAQVTILRCDGVDRFADHRVQSCPIYGAAGVPPTGRTIAWSSVLAEIIVPEDG